MPDRVTVTSSQSWFSRLGESIKSVLFGAILFLAGFPLLFTNEGRAVRTAKSLDEGAGVVQSVSPDVVDPSKDGELVHVSGFTSTEDVLSDETFGVSENAIHLARDVEMYQWVENKSSSSETRVGGSEETTTTYEYETEWRDSLVSSSSFQSPAGHENPSAMPYDSRAEQARRVELGAFVLSDSQIRSLRRREPLTVSSVPSGLRNARAHDGYVYIGANPGAPEVGDVRVKFSVVRPGPVSVVARQTGPSFEPYNARAGANVFLLEESLVSAEAMFDSAQQANTNLTWFLRFVGFLVMFIGLRLVFRPIAVFGDVVPIVGRLLGAGIGAFSAFVAAFFAFGTIAIAWIAYRPLLGVTLLALAAGAIYLLIRKVKKNAPATASTPPPLPPLPNS